MARTIEPSKVELVSKCICNDIDPVVGTIEDFQKEGRTAGNYNNIQRPHLKAIMEEKQFIL